MATPETNSVGDKRILLICFAAIILLFYDDIVTGFGSITDAVRSIKFYPGVSSVILLPFVFVPIGVYYFRQKQKPGWTIITGWLTFSVVKTIYAFALVQSFSKGAGEFAEIPIPLKRIIIHYLLPFLLYGGLLIYINNPVIRNDFNMNSNTRYLIMGLTAIATLLILFQI